MPDLLRRFVFEGSPVRGAIAQLEGTWQAVLERHAYPPALRQVLGEAMAACALLASTIKLDGALVLQVQGGHPVRLLVVECTREGTLRATAKWDDPLPEQASASELLAGARCALSLIAADGQTAYQGVVDLRGRDIAQMLGHYLAHSEQIDSELHLACDEHHASGLLLQRLPGRPDADSDRWPRVRELAATIRAPELPHLPAPELLRRLFHEEDLRLFDPSPLAFRCSCSASRVAAMLRMLGREEVDSVLAERGVVEVGCEFCGRQWRFDPIDAARALAATDAPDGGRSVH